ncbi:hypothetical protein PS623_04101 [Pseudomonas fluorescens]|nr:hypothetical protein PS623_04101 [Pseudomonas fluorescens]
MGDRRRWRAIRCGQAGGGRNIASRIAQGDLQGGAAGLRCRQSDLELASRVDGTGSQHRATGVAHGDDGPDFALAADHGSCAIEADAAGRQGRLQVWRSGRRCQRNVVAGVALGDGQQLRIGLWRSEADAEQAGTADRRRTEQGAIGIHYRNGRADLAATRQQAAAAVNRQLCWRIRRRGVLSRDDSRYRRFACAKARVDLQGLGVELSVAEEHPEDTIAAHRRSAQGGAGGGHSDQCTDCAHAGQDEAVSAEVEVGRCCDFAAIRAGQRCAGFAARVLDHYSGAVAAGQRRVDRHHEAAVRACHHAAYVFAVSVTHDHRAAGLGVAADAGAIRADADIGRFCGYGGVRGGDRQHRAGVGGRIDSLQQQRLTVVLAAWQLHAEATVCLDIPSDQLDAVGIANDHLCGTWSSAGDRAVIGHADAVGQGWRGQVGRGDWHHIGFIAAIGGDHAQALAVFLRWVENDAEIAAWRHGGAADHSAGSVTHFDRAARFTPATDLGAIGVDLHAGWQGRGSSVDGVDGHARGGLPLQVGDSYRQLLAGDRHGVEREAEAAAVRHHHTADEVPVRVAHLNRRAGFGLTADQVAARIELHPLSSFRGLQVWRGQGVRLGDVASLVLLRGGQGLAVELDGVEGDLEAAIALHGCAAKDDAASAGHGDDAAWLTASTEHTAVRRQYQAGGRIGGLAVRGGDGHCGGDIARRIALLDGQCLAVVLGWAEGNREAAVGLHYRAAEHCTVSGAYGYGSARFAKACDLATGAIDRLIADRLRCLSVGRSEVDRTGTVAAAVGGFDGQFLAVALGLVEGHAEVAVGAYRATAQHGTVGSPHGDQRAGLTDTGQLGAGDIQCHLRRLQRAVEVRRSCAGAGLVACRIAQLDVEHLAIGLGGDEGDGEYAIGAYQRSAQQIALSVAHFYCGAGFAAPG